MFDTLQETHERFSQNDEYENFVTTHLETAVECIPTKPRAKFIVPWESKAIKEKQDNILKKASLLNKRNPTNINMHTLKKVKKKLTQTYQKEQLVDIHDQINKIRNLVENKQFQLV